MFDFIIDVFCKDTVTGLSLFDSKSSSSKSEAETTTPLYKSEILMLNGNASEELNSAYREVLYGKNENHQKLLKNKYERLFRHNFKNRGFIGFTDPIACHL